jgi:hypothetical protein
MTAGVIFRTMLRGIERESPAILTVLGSMGVITTVVMGIGATPKALLLLEEERLKRDPRGNKDIVFTKMDTVKVVWKCYLPTALMGATTIGCFVGAHSINLRRQAVLASLYTISETSLKKYQEKVIEVIGENKERKIREGLIQDELDQNPASKNEIIVTGGGETLFYDSWSGRYFKSDMEKVRKIQNDLNYNFLGGKDSYLALNDFYMELGLEPVESGNDMGWSLDYGQLELQFTSKITDNGIPCIVLNYQIHPKHF